MLSSKYWNPRTELMPRRNLEQIQLNKLKHIVKWAYENSSFWKKKLDQAGVKPEYIKKLDDIKIIPYLTRQELNQTQIEQPMFGKAITISPHLAVRYHQTSGTSGKGPLRILDGWKDWEWVSEAWCYGMYGFGVRDTDIVYLAYGYGNFIGFWSAHYASEKIGAMTLPSGGMSSKDRINKIIEMGATVLVCTPTYAIRLAQVAAEMGINLARDSKIRLLIHAGEPGASIPGTKKMLEDAWGAKVGDFPGMSETGGSTSYECSEQCGGLHILEDHYIQEVIDPDTTKILGYGQKGELALTSFGRAALPVIRYRTGDLVERVESDYCSCGRTFDLYKGGILGRADDMKHVKGVNIFPSAVENIIREFREVNEFQIVIYTERDIDQIKIKIEPLPWFDQLGYQHLKAAIAEQLYRAHRLSFGVEIVEPGSLPKYELKSRRLQDLRNK